MKCTKTKKLKPLPYQLPPHFAGILGIDPTYLYRINNGERHPGEPLARKILTLAKRYPSLSGLKKTDLRPTCKGCPYVK